jgi:glycosyltransferase involved in cell wall biosynthesis
MHGPKWAIDSLVVGEGSLFSHGWVASPTEGVLELSMLIRYDGGMLETVPAQYGLLRADVSNAFPEMGSTCGFMVHAALKFQGKIASISLQALLGNGSRKVWACPIPGDLAVVPYAAPVTARLPWQRLLLDGMRVPKMLVTGQWRAVWAGARSRWRWLQPKSADERELKKLLDRFGSESVLIVDHSLGGGANLFRERLVQKHVDAGRSVAVWTFVPYLLKYELRLHFSAGEPESRRSVGWASWALLARSGKFTNVEFNNCVGFPRQEDMGAALASFKSASGAKLRFYLHDYHMVCPSHFLLNDVGKFCGVPEREQCRRCLPKIQDNLANLFVARDIDLWRDRWASALDSADEIIHFSLSTRELFSKAYPDIREDQWHFRPHHVPQWQGRFVYPTGRNGVRVGVIGHIGRAKGSEVVLELARFVKRQGANLEIVVIGTVEGAFDGLPVTATGHYKHADLAQLINANQLHMALMPSVVPETFSYVTHELMQLEVPIICFDLGAQAEVVSRYAKGCVVPLSSSDQLLLSIQNFKFALENQSHI